MVSAACWVAVTVTWSLVRRDGRRAELAGSGRLVGDGAGVEVGLGHAVGGRAGDRRADGECGGRGARDGRVIVSDRERAAERHVAAVREQIAVRDRVADAVIGRGRRRLVEGEARMLGLGEEVSPVLEPPAARTMPVIGLVPVLMKPAGTV